MAKVYFYPAHKYECHRWISIEDICVDECGNRICFESEDGAIDFLKNKYGFPVEDGWAIPYGDEIAVYAISKIY